VFLCHLLRSVCVGIFVHGQGTIAKGQKQLIESSSGKIQFDFRRSIDDRTYGDSQADCVNGNVISMP
jgi:hypothetical protein